MEIKHLIVGPLLTNCYILRTKDEALVLDPGGGVKTILNEVGKRKLKFIILTHHHWDHTLSALPLSKKTQAKILIHEGERNFVSFKVDQFLKEGDEIKIGESALKIIHTPGHTKGGICILGDGFIFTGDTIFADGYGRTDLPGGSEKDLKNSLEKLEKIIKPGFKIYPGHGPIFVKE